MIKLTETNWHRLISKFQPTGFSIISACRKELSPAENKENTKKLYKDLVDKCLKPIKCVGGWIEDEGTPTEKEVNEVSFFVPFFFGGPSFSSSKYDNKATHIFYKWMLELGEKYGQESILYCAPGGKPRYVQATEKNYGDGPVKPGTHFDRFNGVKHNDKNSPYYTDLVHPKYQNGYNQETGKFSKVARRFTFESIKDSFDRVMKFTEESRIDPNMKVGNMKFYYPAESKNSISYYSFAKPKGAKYLKALKYIVDHPGCKRAEIEKAAGFKADRHQGLFQCMSNEEFFRITTKGEYFATQKGVDFVKKNYNPKDFKSTYQPENFVFDEPYILDTEGHYAWDYESELDFLNNSEPEFTDGIPEYKDLEQYDNLKDWWDAHYDEKGMAMTCEYHQSLKQDAIDCVNEYNECREVRNGDYPKLGEIGTWGEEDGYCWVNFDASNWVGEKEDDIEEFVDLLLYCYRGADLNGINWNDDKSYATGYLDDSGTFSFCWKADILKTGAL